MGKNFHIFSDHLGFFTNRTVGFIESVDPERNIYLNSEINCKNKIDQVLYSTPNLFFENNKSPIKRIIFHSYKYEDIEILNLIKSKFPDNQIIFIWIFWSYEYYQLPEFFSNLYQGFSRKFYLRKLLSFHVLILISFLKGKISYPFYKGISAHKKTFKHFKLFVAFLEGDYNNVMSGNSDTQFYFSSYLSLADFDEIPNDLSMNKTDIMVGHSGSPIGNHFEILRDLTNMKISTKIIVPLSYGKKAYIKKLSKKIKSLENNQIDLMTDYYSKSEYYQKISNVGYFILNAYCQQALGNIVFFLWSGAKIFLRENTSTYKTFKKQSFHIFSLEKDWAKENFVPLTLEEKLHNQKLIVALINVENVKEHWLKILNFEI